ncbi:MAG: DUF5615 family PIN-like protein [Verrucomicrobia bacterium]|nr:DUF5615 family PIN-like protein [Verrucomicrobiota bacterium]
MKVLLDECVPRPIRTLLPSHEVSTVQQAGWGRISNGDLLLRAEERFEVFITSDKNLRYQQKLSSRRIGIIELLTTDWVILNRMSQALNDAINSLNPKNSYIEIQLPKHF